jgi:hypothetical protein
MMKLVFKVFGDESARRLMEDARDTDMTDVDHPKRLQFLRMSLDAALYRWWVEPTLLSA